MTYSLTIHSFPYLICIAWSAVITIILFTKKPRIALCYSNLGIILWFIGTGLTVASDNNLPMQKYVEITYYGVIFICPFLLHFIFQFLKFKNIRVNIILLFNYFIALLFVFLLLTGQLVSYHKIQWFYYTKAEIYHPIFLIWFFIQGSFILFLLIKSQFNKTYLPAFRNKIKYVTLTYTFAIIGSIDYITLYNPNFYPFGYIITTLGLTITAYAVLKHQLLDIKIVIQKGLIYSILLSFISLMYILLIFIGENAFKSIYGYTSFASSITIALFLGIILVPLRNQIQYYIDKVIYKGTSAETSKKIELLEREVADKEKFKAVATLASGMSHEIKNPLTAIKTFSEYLPQKIDDKEFLNKFVKIVSHEVDRIDAIINQLMEFSKPAPPAPKPTAIHKLIDDTLDFLNSQFIQHHIDIKRNYDPNQILIMIDPNQIRQVLLNLFLNAIDAIHDHGQITITTHVKNTNTFSIAITDTGKGIPKKIIKEIFDPFVTHKSHGTGLGLAISRSIIEEHKGTIGVHSKESESTTFTIELPIGEVQIAPKS